MFNWKQAKDADNMLREQMMGMATRRDLNDTNDEMMRMDSDMWKMTEDLTIDQKKSLMDVMKKHIETIKGGAKTE